MAPRALPRGYVGINHETLGADLLAVLSTVRAPEDVLGTEVYVELRSLDPAAWYPIDMLLELLDYLQQRAGRAALVKMGRQLFRDSHAQRVAPEVSSAGDVIFGFDGWYRHANRGEQIGGWVVKRFSPGVAVLEKTTPHLCSLEQGILIEALRLARAESLIVQPQCFHQGAESCIFEIHSAVRDARWMGAYAAVP
jgi:hypothetical protein